MGAAGILQAVLLTGAIVPGLSTSRPISGSLSVPSREQRIPITSRSPFSTTILPTTIRGYLQHHQTTRSIPVPEKTVNDLSSLSQEIVNDSRFSGDGSFQVPRGVQEDHLTPPNFLKVVDQDPYTTHTEKYPEVTAQSRIMAPVYHYETGQSYNQPPGTLEQSFIPPTFSPSLEQNLGKFEPFPPFKYSHTKSLFTDIEPQPSGARNSNLDFGLTNSNFMARPQNYPVIYSGNQGMQVRIPAREFPGFNSFYKKGPRPIQPYQPLSSQPQLHFSHQVNNPGKIRNQGEMENDLEGNPVAGRGTPGRDVAFIPSNFGNTHLMTPFTSYSFEVPTSGIFNDYDKTFAKYTPSVLSEVEKEKVDGHSDNSPDSHGNEEENKEKDEKSVTEDQSEEVSASHEQYNDEEGESHNERRGKNSRKREENDHRDKYDKNGGYDFEREFEESYKQKAFEDSETRDADERRKGQERTSSRPRKARRDRKGRDDTPNRTQCHESPSFVSGDSRESSKSDKKRLPGRPTFGHKILHRRPSRFTSHESSDGASSGKSRVSDKSGDFPNQSNRKIPPPSPSQNSSSH